MLFKDVYNSPCIACVFEKPFLFGQNTRRFSTVYNSLTIRVLCNLLRKTMQNHMKNDAICIELPCNYIHFSAQSDANSDVICVKLHDFMA